MGATIYNKLNMYVNTDMRVKKRQQRMDCFKKIQSFKVDWMVVVRNHFSSTSISWNQSNTFLSSPPRTQLPPLCISMSNLRGLKTLKCNHPFVCDWRLMPGMFGMAVCLKCVSDPDGTGSQTSQILTFICFDWFILCSFTLKTLMTK